MRNSYSLIPILLKLYRHCDDALKICMWLGYTRKILFLSLFLQFEFSHVSDIFTTKVRYLVCATAPTVSHQSPFKNFTCILDMV